MTRLPLVEVDGKGDRSTRDVFREIQTIRGEVTNLFRVVANEPTLLPAFFGMSRRLRDRSTLPARLSRFAVLRGRPELSGDGRQADRNVRPFATKEMRIGRCAARTT